MFSKKLFIATLALSGLLAGCGSDSESQTAATSSTEAPPSTSASTTETTPTAAKSGSYCNDVKAAVAAQPKASDPNTSAGKAQYKTYAAKLQAVVASAPASTKQFWQDTYTVSNGIANGDYSSDTVNKAGQSALGAVEAAGASVAKDCNIDIGDGSE